MIYIFDTTHETQINSNFTNDLISIVNKFKIDIIAEEADDLNSFDGVLTIAYQYFLSHKIVQYINIEDKSLHIPIPPCYINSCPIEVDLNKYRLDFHRKNFNRREAEWLKRIIPFKDKNILLVFGLAHFQSFTNKLNQNNILWQRLDSYSIIPNNIIVSCSEYTSHPLFSYIFE